MRRWGWGFVHRSRTIFCRPVPNLTLRFATFFIAVHHSHRGLSGEAGAGQGAGYVTVSGVEQRLGWNRERVASTLDALLSQQIALIDDGAKDGRRRYWLPAISPAAAAAVA